MTKKYEVYKCEICGNVVEIIEDAKSELYCCGKAMKVFEEKTADTSIEKHVPFIERVADAYIVRVGENTPHPMEETHHIDWIELTVDGTVYKKYLTAGDKPEAEFKVPEGTKVSAREFCNLHGLWVKN